MNNRILKLILLDALASAFGLYIAFILRFEFSIPQQFMGILVKWLPLFLLSQIIVFYISGLYARIWRYTSLFDLLAIIRAVTISSAVSIIGVLFLMGSTGYPRSVLVLYFFFNIVFTSTIRLSVRVYYSHFHENSILITGTRKKLLLVGAGKTGEKIAREILTTPGSQYKVIGFADDDPQKLGGMLHGLKIFCSINNIPDLTVPFDEVLITAPKATGEQMRRIVDICKKVGKHYKTVPGLDELIDKDVSLAVVRDVSYVDLLGRAEVKLDMNSIEDLLKGKRVLITGAGGSIGSELVRQCLNFEPAELICLDRSEEKIFNLERDTVKLKSKTIIKPVLANVNYIKELDKVFLENRPQIVYHAAAYKHVPIQELHPWTAVKTNLGGTLNLVECSNNYTVDKFVLVSTDKAVNPVNVMGATKRAAEKLIQSKNVVSDTRFMAVRFGNVLGSSGSAIPTFQKQINEGGPLTVTHPEMTRYFMSIQEASQLILQSSALEDDGEIFLLEMGNPIKIIQMARDLIKLSGLEPETDIPIVYTGLRPGEKLYEELQSLDERKVNTNHKKIMILKDGKSVMPWEAFKVSVKGLLNVAKDLESDKIQAQLKELLPTYQPRSFTPVTKEDQLNPYAIKGEA